MHQLKPITAQDEPAFGTFMGPSLVWGHMKSRRPHPAYGSLSHILRSSLEARKVGVYLPRDTTSSTRPTAYILKPAHINGPKDGESYDHGAHRKWDGKVVMPTPGIEYVFEGAKSTEY